MCKYNFCACRRQKMTVSREMKPSLTYIHGEYVIIINSLNNSNWAPITCQTLYKVLYRVRGWVTTSAGRAYTGSCPRPRCPRWLAHPCKENGPLLWTETWSPFWEHLIQGSSWLCSLHPWLLPMDAINSLPTKGRLNALALSLCASGVCIAFLWCFIFLWLYVFFSVRFLLVKFTLIDAIWEC